MARYALVIDGEVKEERNYDEPPVSKSRDGKPLLRPIQEVTREYNRDTQTYTISREVQNFKVVDTWVVQDLPAEVVEAKFLAALAARRYAVETGGVTVNGATIQTDRESRSNLHSARTVALEAKAYAALKEADPTAADATQADAKAIYERALDVGVTWKAAGGFVTLPVDHVIYAANVAFAFVQRCFAAEAAVASAIGEYDSVAAVVAAFDAAVAP